MSGILSQLRNGGHVCNLQGKEFVLLSGLLSLSHENGLESLDTTMIEHDPGEKSAVFRCLATGSRGAYSGHGDASPANLSRNMVPSYIRMAETRSIARALRFYLGIGMCARDELPGNSPPPPPPPPPQKPEPKPEPKPESKPNLRLATGQPDHHPSWEEDRKGFCAALGEFGGYERVAMWAESEGHGRPSHWPGRQRSRLLDKLKSGEVELEEIPF